MEQQEFYNFKTELKGYFDKAAEEKETLGATLEETKTAIHTLTQKMEAIQTQTDAIDVKLAKRFSDGDPDQPKTVGEQFVESASYTEAKEKGFRLGARDGVSSISTPVDNPFAGRKTTITTGGIGTGTTGVQMPFRLPGITPLPRLELRIRDLMTVRQMTAGNSFDYVRMLARTNNASPQVEATTKAESTYTWESKSDTVKTIAHFTNISRQAIDDIPWLQTMINSELMYGLLLKEEQEILSGDGTGQHLNGLITQASAYNTTYNMTGDTKLDIVRHAKLQARLFGLATFAPDGIVLHPYDMEKIELIKEENGGANRGLYIIGDPRNGTAIKYLWNLPVVESDSIAQNTFLVGAFGTAAELIDRMAAMIAISWEHSTNFTANLATILCEERLGMAVRVPGAFVTGNFGTTSP